MDVERWTELVAIRNAWEEGRRSAEAEAGGHRAHA